MSFLSRQNIDQPNHPAEVVPAWGVTVCEHAEASQAEDNFEISMEETQHAARPHTASHILNLLVVRSSFSTEMNPQRYGHGGRGARPVLFLFFAQEVQDAGKGRAGAVGGQRGAVCHCN